MNIRSLSLVISMAAMVPLTTAHAGGVVQSGIYDAADTRATSWNSVSVQTDDANPEVFTVAFGQTERDDAAVRALEFDAAGGFTYTDVPSTTADISWPGVAICVVGGLIACILFYPNTAEGEPDPDALYLGIRNLDLDQVQRDRLFDALVSLNVAEDVGVYDIFDALPSGKARR